jgi:integrase
MSQSKLTAATAAAAPSLKKEYTIGDGACPGLRLRITANGIKTFAYAYRDRATGKVIWVTIGRYPGITVARARELTNDLRRQIAAGKAPHQQSAPALKKSPQVPYADVVARYYESTLRTQRTGHATRTTLQRIGRDYSWNERPVASITDDEAATMLHDIAVKRGKNATAKQTKHILHAMFQWARQPGPSKSVTVNPFAGLKTPGGKIKPRERFLTDDEIRLVWRALDEPQALGIKLDAATALRLILVTAARPGMVRGMVGSELRDLRGPSEHGPHWSLPAERMKAGSAFITPLSPLALELIRPHLKADPAAPLFDVPRYYLHHAAKLVVDKLGMHRWTPHDLRRTAATILDKQDYSLEQIGALLAHTRKGVTAIYARWDKFDLRREMAMAIERSLRETLAGESAAVVAA